MFRFQKEQEIINIAGVKIGGQPGELPTTLAGTIFYSNHKIVENADEGLFDKNAAEELVNVQEKNSDETGNPHLVHIFANTEKSMTRYVDFIANITDAPFIIDSPDPQTRMHAAQYVTEIGLADRTVYNSINMSISDDEREVLKNSDVDSSIILGFNAMNSSLEGRMELLENGGGITDIGLVDIAKECDIVNILIDPSITPMGNGAGIALRMTLNAKAKWGYPVGSGIHNAPSAWSWLKGKKEENYLAYQMCDIASTGLQQVAGGDFVLYGPIENAPYTFPLAAMGDIMIAEATADLDTEPSSNHPINILV